MADSSDERKRAAPEPLIYAVMDPSGDCIKLTEDRATADKFIIQQKFETALRQLYGDDAMAKLTAAVVTVETALARLFGDDAIGRINTTANSLSYTVDGLSPDSIVRAAKDLTKGKHKTSVQALPRE